MPARLPAGERRIITIGVRLTADEYERLKAGAEAAGVRTPGTKKIKSRLLVGRFLRESGLHMQSSSIKPEPGLPARTEDDEQIAHRQQLVRIGSNLNQAVRRLHKLSELQDLPAAALDMLAVLDELRPLVAAEAVKPKRPA